MRPPLAARRSAFADAQRAGTGNLLRSKDLRGYRSLIRMYTALHAVGSSAVLDEGASGAPRP